MQELAEFLARILKWTMAAAILAGLAFLAVIGLDLDSSPLHGWHAKDDPPAAPQAACNCETPAQDEPQHRARRFVPPPVEWPPEVKEVEDDPPAPFNALVTEAASPAPPVSAAPSPVVVFVPVVPEPVTEPLPQYQFSTTARAKNIPTNASSSTWYTQ